MSIIDHYGLSPVQPHKGTLPIWAGFSIKSEELIGIEVEVENTNNLLHDTALNNAWGVTDDGSLRNNGMEFISKPIHAHYAPTALQYLMEQVLTRNCSFSPRTSVHIHLNMQEATASQVSDFLGMYCIFEKLLYQYVGRGRYKNIYCVPIIETDLVPGYAHKSLRVEWKKYTGLNLVPLASYGTVEFRHMHGTFGLEKLCGWIQLIVSLKEHVIRGKRDIKKRIFEMTNNTDWYTLLEEVFGEHHKLLTIKTPNDFINGLATAKSMYFNPSIVSNLRAGLNNSHMIVQK